MELKKLSVEEIKERLSSEYGYSQEEITNIGGKVALREALDLEIKKHLVFGDEEAVSGYADELEEVEMDRSSPGWSDYVISLFREDEMMVKNDNKYPTLKGLRRVFYNIFGPPSFSGVIDYASPTIESSPGRAHANYELVFYDCGREMRYRGAADAYPGNIAGGYQVYPLAIAENRAEARAYRKALMLNIVTAEEMGNEESHFVSVLSSTGEFDESELMNDNQIIVVKNKSKELNIDPDKFLDFMKKELGVSKLSKKEGLQCVKRISSYSNDPRTIPGELK
jgi:hypothetical protein